MHAPLQRAQGMTKWHAGFSCSKGTLLARCHSGYH